MIRIMGKKGRGKTLLEQAVQALGSTANKLISWGVEYPNALNGMRRLDAVEQLEAMNNAGIKVPEFTTDLHRASEWVREGCLVFGRRLFHTEGRDIIGPRHRRWPRSEYWVKVIPNIGAEWRIHVFQGRSIARGMKVQTGESWRKMPVRNRANGWTMVHDPKPPKGLRTLAKAAVEAVGYDFGAVDLLVQEDGTQWVLEVNKAPGLDQSSAVAYAKAIVGGG